MILAVATECFAGGTDWYKPTPCLFAGQRRFFRFPGHFATPESGPETEQKNNHP
jgi:hypothetical protein